MGGIIGRLTSGFAEGRYIMIGPKLSCTGVRKVYRIPMAVGLAVIILLSAVMMNTITAAAEGDGKLTYSVYPYLPDAGYYAKLKTIAENDNNKLFRAYGSFMEETYGE